MKIEIYHLKDIAEFNLTGRSANSPIRLPEVQRGLVWKAHQVELLWDSILSEYPIGSFMIVNKELYDGQQRVTAITSGFDFDSLYKTDSPYSILWLDLEFQETTSRRYGFRVTTKAHPWGYNDGSAYATSRRRAELDRVYPAAEDGKRKAKEEWDIRHFRPCDAKLPVPFAILLKALYEDGNFAETAISYYKLFAEEHHCIEWSGDVEQRIRKACDQIYETLTKINDYQVVANTIENKSIDNKYLELFFNRINTGGTRISPEELAYSAMKLYWQNENYSQSPDEQSSLAMVNREMSKEYLPEAKFAQIIFRAICSTDQSIRGEIDAAYIRELKTNDDKKNIVDQINELYRNGGVYLSEIMQKMSDNFGEIPKYVRVEIGRDMPILYILLFVIAKMQKDKEINDIRKEYMQALIIYLYCCCSGNEKPIQYIYGNLKKVVSDGISIDENIFNCWLSDCISYEWSNYVSGNVKEFKAFQENNISPKWNIWDYQYEVGGKQICQMFGYLNNYHQTAMLKIVEREAFKKFFNDYNPVRQDLWEQTNRPWDDDHIIPKDWIAGKRPLWRNTVEKWIWSIGNFAHIPFEENRSKKNKDDWSFYNGENTPLLHFKQAITSTQSNFMNDEKSSREFIRVTAERFCDIYEEFAKLLQPLNIGSCLSPLQEARKSILLSFKKDDNYKLYYVAEERDVVFNADNNFGWMQAWVSVAKANDDATLNSLTIGILQGSIDGAKCDIEVGVRKDPLKSLKDTDNQSWWNPGGVISKTIDSKELSLAGVTEYVDKASKELRIIL